MGLNWIVLLPPTSRTALERGGGPTENTTLWTAGSDAGGVVAWGTAVGTGCDADGVVAWGTAVGTGSDGAATATVAAAATVGAATGGSSEASSDWHAPKIKTVSPNRKPIPNILPIVTILSLPSLSPDQSLPLRFCTSLSDRGIVVWHFSRICIVLTFCSYAYGYHLLGAQSGSGPTIFALAISTACSVVTPSGATNRAWWTRYASGLLGPGGSRPSKSSLAAFISTCLVRITGPSARVKCSLVRSMRGPRWFSMTA